MVIVMPAVQVPATSPAIKENADNGNRVCTATRETEFAKFGEPDGTFTGGDIDVFAYDMDRTTLTLPFQR